MPAPARRIERTPGGDRTFAGAASRGMRLREVEIHHADLDAGYTHADWPARDRGPASSTHDAGWYDGPPASSAHATDLDRDLGLRRAADRRARSSGPAAALALVGSPAGTRATD